ncbi:MAG: ribose-phosphate pyrophosphokinase [Mycobacterium sp.]|nr:MAG: ribose-phosphate pyrophosphokinase [Mycobacterium sp.]
MSDYEFFALDTEALTPEPIEVFAYPMGDVTVRRTDDAELSPGVQVLWVRTPAPDWSVVFNWASLVGDSDRRVLVMPYLPSARGDKDLPSPARTNARLAALSGITDIVTVDPHSTVWLVALSAANPAVGRWELDLATIVGDAVAASGPYQGVIGPDAGSKARASLVGEQLEIPVLIASKSRDQATGKLKGYQAPDGVQTGRYLVMDDICDGGGTFALLRDAMPPEVTLDLWVTHGGFTGPEHSRKALSGYRRVHTTDSLSGARDAHVHITRLAPYVTQTIRRIAGNSEGTQR